MKKILVIDDDRDLLKLLEVGLHREGFEVLTAIDGSSGLRMAFQFHPDLVILDIMLPGMDGWETCRRVRELSDLPIIMLTAKARDVDVVKGLTIGADDYITKPFGVEELVARVQACLRRAESADSHLKSAVLVSGDLMIDFARHKVTVRRKAVDLTPTEFRLLSYLARNRGCVVPHRTLLREVWGPEYEDELQYLRLYVHYLRTKIEEDPRQPQYIIGEWGVGYRFEGG